MLIATGAVLIVVLTAATSFFVAQEFAYVAVDRARLRTLADDGDAAAGRALRVTRRLSFVLSGAQVGITVTALLVGYVAEPFLGQGLAAVLGLTGLSPAVSLSVSLTVALLFATVVQMVFGELAPKNLAIARPETLARALAGPTLVYLAVAGPVIRVFDATANRLLRLVGIEPVEELPQGATAEDLDRIIAAAHAHGSLDADSARLLDHGLDFRTRTAGETMTARVDVVTVGAAEPAIRVVELLATGHSRFPVLRDDLDDVAGVVSISDVVALEPSQRRTTPIGALVGTPVWVPESLPLPAVLEHLKSVHRQLAVVVDEYGGFAGVLSLEDVAEELVGDIRDEDDLPEPAIVSTPDGSWLLPGRARIDEIHDATGVALPSSDAYDTVSGLVLARLGHVPSTGEELTVALPAIVDTHEYPRAQGVVRLRVQAVRRHVPDTVWMSHPSGRHGGGTR